jgi:methylenetetrahydrofolate dehydrogenase (NADP+)/methenyltetrahydrofolate cyclohydrolase
MKIINGKQIAENLNLDLSNQIARFKQQSGKIPCLVVIIVGDNPASHVYVRNKEKKALEVGIKSLIVKLEKSIEENKLLNIIHKYNDNDEVDGILV